MLHYWAESPNDIHSRLVAFGDFEHSGLEPQIAYSEPLSIADTSFSMAPTLVDQYTPSLSSFTAFTTTEPYQPESPTSTPHTPQTSFPPPTPSYKCLFWFLTCPYHSPSQSEWETHCLTHFRGEPPPRKVSCPLCDWACSRTTGSEAWALRTRHLAEHLRAGHALAASRPDYALFTHLWQRRLIGDQDLKELKGGNHNLTRGCESFVTVDPTAGRRRRAKGGYGTQSVGVGVARRA